MRRWSLAVVVYCAFVIGTAVESAQTAKLNSVLDMTEFVRYWQISKQFAIDVTNAMPAEFYSFKPNPEEMTFGEQMIHVAGFNGYRFREISGAPPPFPFDPSKVGRLTRRPPLNYYLEQSTEKPGPITGARPSQNRT